MNRKKMTLLRSLVVINASWHVLLLRVELKYFRSVQICPKVRFFWPLSDIYVRADHIM